MNKQGVALMITEGSCLGSVLTCVANKTVGNTGQNIHTNGSVARENE